MRRDRKNDLGLGDVGVVAREQAAQDRHLAQTRHLGGVTAIRVADQAAEDLRLAIAQPQVGRGTARADLIGQCTVLTAVADLLDDVADLEVQFDSDIALAVHLRLDFEFYPDIDVLHRARHHGGAGADRSHRIGDHRQLIADQDLGLLLVASTDPWAGKQIGVRVLQLEVDADAKRRRDLELVAGQASQSANRVGGTRCGYRYAVWPLHAQIGRALT